MTAQRPHRDRSNRSQRVHVAGSGGDAGHLVEVEGDAARALDLPVAVDADEGLRLLVEGVLERDDHKLVRVRGRVRVRVSVRVGVGVGVWLGLGVGLANLVVALLGPLADEVCDARDVDVVESCSGLGVGLGSVVRVRVRVRVRGRVRGWG